MHLVLYIGDIELSVKEADKGVDFKNTNDYYVVNDVRVSVK